MMWSSSSLAIFAVAFTLAGSVDAAGLYTKKSPVIQVSGNNFGKLISKSNYTSIVEFYAPWCGHCQNLKPAYEKAAKNLQGFANVAAVNCDEDENKQLCGQQGVQGFPTLKIFKPTKKAGKPGVEEYRGGRTAKDIVDAVIERIPNHVARLDDKKFDGWLNNKNDTLKAVLFTDKGTISPLIKSVAIDFLGKITIGQIKSSEKEAAKSFGINKYPTLVLLPGGDHEGFVYEGLLKKEPITKFLSAFTPSNAESAAKAAEEAQASKKAKKDNAKKDKKAKNTSEKKTGTADEKERIVLGESDYANLGPEEKQKFEDAHTRARYEQAKKVAKQPVEPVFDEDTLREKCLSEKSKHCVLILLPAVAEDAKKIPIDMIDGLQAFQEITEKHQKRDANIPTYMVRPDMPIVALTRASLGLKSADQFQVIVVNGRRGWWSPYLESHYSAASVEAWLDTIRMNEVTKHNIPKALLTVPIVEEPKKDAKQEPEPAAPQPAAPKAEEPAQEQAAKTENSAAEATQKPVEPEPAKDEL